MNKKLLVIIYLICLLFTFNVNVFADDYDENESNNPDTTETNETKNDESKTDDINLLTKDINDLKLSVKSINDNLQYGNYGLMTNYDLLNEAQLNYFIENFNNLILFGKINSAQIIFLTLSDINNLSIRTRDNNSYYVDISNYYYVWNFNSNTYEYREGSLSTYIFTNLIGDNNSVSWYLLKDSNNTYYSLTPYIINIKNNGLNEYSITPESKYNLGYYPSGQTITLTYDDTYEDFTGWYDTNGNLISNQNPYTFNINQNTNLVINYYTNPTTFDYTNLLYMIIGLLVLIFLNNSTKGVLN